MLYTIHHVTTFVYDRPISESVMEARVQPRSDGAQRLVQFSLSTTPRARVLAYQDYDGNAVHHFNIPGHHQRLEISADAVVDCQAVPDTPLWLDGDAWARLDDLAAAGDLYDTLAPSRFARPTPLLEAFAAEIRLDRGPDPLSTLRRVTEEMYAHFDYDPRSTSVDSPIDHALEAKKGVCQDFAHIFIALARRLGVPCRYVSGYLFHSSADADRSGDGATHAWVEAFLPDLGWTGFDPTNNLLACDRHIRVAIGRDYADVPPTRGVFKGASSVRNELAVAVKVGSGHGALPSPPVGVVPWKSRPLGAATGGLFGAPGAFGLTSAPEVGARVDVHQQ